MMSTTEEIEMTTWKLEYEEIIVWMTASSETTITESTNDMTPYTADFYEVTLPSIRNKRLSGSED
jgi:hypothetical protein